MMDFCSKKRNPIKNIDLSLNTFFSRLDMICATKVFMKFIIQLIKGEGNFYYEGLWLWLPQ